MSTNAKIRAACYLALPVVLFCIPMKWITEGHSICLFRNLFGTPCYGCGMTRALFSLLHLDFVAAWEYNWLFVVVAPILLYLYLKEGRKIIKALRHTDRR